MQNENSIPVEILEKARLLESTAYYLIAHQPHKTKMLESLCERPGFDFNRMGPAGGKTILQNAISANDRMVFETVIKYYEKSGGLMRFDDIAKINFKSNFCEYALGI
jgi:hypothetical protein